MKKIVKYLYSICHFKLKFIVHTEMQPELLYHEIRVHLTYFKSHNLSTEIHRDNIYEIICFSQKNILTRLKCKYMLNNITSK